MTKEKKSAGRPRNPLPDGLRGEIAARILALRTERGWSGPQLAAAAGVGNSTIQRLEAGESMDASSWVAVAAAFCITPAALLNACPSWTNPPPKS